jgi:hypothetical protein
MTTTTANNGQGIESLLVRLPIPPLEFERLYVSQALSMVRSDLRQYSSGIRSGHVVTN